MNYGIADRMVPLTGSAIREIFKLLDNPNIISFAGGVPQPRYLRDGADRRNRERASARSGEDHAAVRHNGRVQAIQGNGCGTASRTRDRLQA